MARRKLKDPARVVSLPAGQVRISVKF